jgi:methyl-accepting chemotaxis protein
MWTSRRRFRPGNETAQQYAAWIGIFLFCYSLLVYGVCVLAPYVMPAITLASSAPLAEREQAAARFLLLGEIFWPVFVTLFVGAAFFSVFLARRIAGPLHRLNAFARELARGNLTARIHLRTSDQLEPLAAMLNRATKNFDTSLREAHEQSLQARDAVRSALDELAAEGGPGGSRGMVERLELAMKAADRIGEIVEEFRSSDPNDARGSV